MDVPKERTTRGVSAVATSGSSAKTSLVSAAEAVVQEDTAVNTTIAIY